MSAEVVMLDANNHIGSAHAAIDRYAKEYEGEPASVLVIGYTPNDTPRLAYYGRELSTYELVGILECLKGTILARNKQAEHI